MKIYVTVCKCFNIFITKKPEGKPSGLVFTAIINTNHQRKNYTVKTETFLFYRRV